MVGDFQVLSIANHRASLPVCSCDLFATELYMVRLSLLCLSASQNMIVGVTMSVPVLVVQDLVAGIGISFAFLSFSGVWIWIQQQRQGEDRKR